MRQVTPPRFLFASARSRPGLSRPGNCSCLPSPSGCSGDSTPHSSLAASTHITFDRFSINCSNFENRLQTPDRDDCTFISFVQATSFISPMFQSFPATSLPKLCFRRPLLRRPRRPPPAAAPTAISAQPNQPCPLQPASPTRSQHASMPSRGCRGGAPSAGIESAIIARPLSRMSGLVCRLTGRSPRALRTRCAGRSAPGRSSR